MNGCFLRTEAYLCYLHPPPGGHPTRGYVESWRQWGGDGVTGRLGDRARASGRLGEWATGRVARRLKPRLISLFDCSKHSNNICLSDTPYILVLTNCRYNCIFQHFFLQPKVQLFPLPFVESFFAFSS